MVNACVVRAGGLLPFSRAGPSATGSPDNGRFRGISPLPSEAGHPTPPLLSHPFISSLLGGQTLLGLLFRPFRAARLGPGVETEVQDDGGGAESEVPGVEETRREARGARRESSAADGVKRGSPPRPPFFFPVADSTEGRCSGDRQGAEKSRGCESTATHHGASQSSHLRFWPGGGGVSPKRMPFLWPSGCAPSAQNPPGGPAPIRRLCWRCTPFTACVAMRPRLPRIVEGLGGLS